MDAKVVREHRTIDGKDDERFIIYIKHPLWPFWMYHFKTSSRDYAIDIAKGLSTPFLKEVIYDSRDPRA